MKRTTIYLEQRQLKQLKQIAAQEGRPRTAVVRRAIDSFLAASRRSDSENLTMEEWNRRLDALVGRVRRRTATFTPDEIEGDITIASKETRRQRAETAARVGRHQRVGVSAA